MTDEEFLEDVYEVRVDFLIANEYLDPNKIQDPVQTVITNQYYASTSPKFYTSYDIYIEKNTYEIDSGILSSDLKTGNLYRAGRTSLNTADFQGAYSDHILMNVKINLDSEVKHFQSKSYKFIDAVGTIGGIFEIMFWLTMLIYGCIRKNMAIYYIVNRIISISNQQKDEKYDKNMSVYPPVSMIDPANRRTMPRGSVSTISRPASNAQNNEYKSVNTSEVGTKF